MLTFKDVQGQVHHVRFDRVVDIIEGEKKGSGGRIIVAGSARDHYWAVDQVELDKAVDWTEAV